MILVQFLVVLASLPWFAAAVANWAAIQGEANAGTFVTDPVPLRFLRRDGDWSPHFPDRFDELLDSLQPAFPGQLFFVGAGICGKVYCDVIARRGGIALDVGAACDAWLGIPSRPRVARSRWGQDSVPEHLLLRHQFQARAQIDGPGTHGES